MKVIRIKNYTPFKAVGVAILKTVNEFSYGIVSNNYSNGEEVFKGTQKECQVYINEL